MYDVIASVCCMVWKWVSGFVFCQVLTLRCDGGRVAQTPAEN
jgi:hypothetical protein